MHSTWKSWVTRTCVSLAALTATDLSADKPNDSGLFASADLLYWTGNQHQVDYKWNAGFKVEGGLFTGYNLWAVRGSWTLLRLRDDSHKFPKELTLDYNLIDARVERHITGNTTEFTPFMGVRTLLFKERIDDIWKANLNAIGLYTGFDFEWNTFKYFGIYTRAVASLLGGCVKDCFRISDVVHHRHLRTKTYQPIPGYDVGAGLLCQWEVQDGVSVEGRLGYDLYQWFNLARVHDRARGPVTGRTIILHGVTAGCQLTF